MKKLFGFIVSVLLVLTGCTEEDMVKQSLPMGKIQASFEDGAASRLAVGEGNALTWSTGDAFKMFDNTGASSDWTLEGDGGTSSGVFGGAELEGVLVGAAFPASASSLNMQTAQLVMELPAELDYQAGICNLPMWARFNSLEGEISFKHLGAMLKIDFKDIPEGYSKMIVTADKAIAGTFAAALSTQSDPVLSLQADGSNTVTISFTAISGDDNDRLFYLPLPVGTYGSINVSISDENDNVISIADWKNRAIERKKVYLASLSYRILEGEDLTPETVTETLDEIVAVTPNATIEIADEIKAEDGAITIPAEAKKVALNFAETPKTSETAPLVIEEAAATQGTELTISLPASSTDSYLTIDAPTTTANVEGGKYKKIVAHTAANTLVLGEGTTVENLVVLGGNVVLRGGQVTASITRDASNSDEVTYVYVSDASELNGVTIGAGVEVVVPDYITLTADAAQTMQLIQRVNNEDTPKEVPGLEYSLNGGAWAELGTSTVTFGGTNSTLRLRNKNLNGTALSENDFATIKFGDDNISVYCTGDIRTLVDYENYNSDELDTSNARFVALFRNARALKSAPKLPAKVLASSAYCHLFNTTGITEAPELPATTLGDRCYSNLFFNCSGLTEAPALPATTLVDNCYVGMFGNCTGLTEAPELPATTMAMNCYGTMFFGCTGLTKAPELPATTLASMCYYGMFQRCTNLTEASELPATTLAGSCYYGMFLGCTSLTEAPELPATTLAANCYANMFQNCSALTEAPALPATTLADNCYANMFASCTSLTKAPVLPATTLAYRCYSQMFTGCTSLTAAPVLPATTLAVNCYGSMFSGCTSLIEAPALPATTLESACYNGMFMRCTSLTKAPILPAAKLESTCYFMMFYNSSNLSEVTMLATDVTAQGCMDNWLTGTAESGTFYGDGNVTDFSAYGIPEGWTIKNAYQIRYTSTDGNIVTPREGSVFGANIVSNTYSDGIGVIQFDGPVTTIDYQGSNISGFDAAFSDCLTLESIEIPNTVTSIGHQSFFGCKNMKSVTLPKNITELKSFTFHNCESLESVVIPDGVTTISQKAFGNNLKLASVTLPKELVTIGQMAFSWCEILPEITIPEKVKTLASSAFWGCNKLNAIHCLPTTPPALADYTSLPQNSGETKIYVPASSLDAYIEAWPDFNGFIFAEE